MRRREYLRGADLQHWRPVQRFVGECKNLAGETVFADDQRAGGVGVIAAVGHHGAGVLDVGKDRRVFGQFAENDAVTAIAQVMRQFHVLLVNHERCLGAPELFEQRFDGASVPVKQHLAGHRRQDVWQARLEALFKERQQEHRKNQEDEKLPHELPGDHEQGDDRMLPVAVVAVAGRRQRFRCPLQAFQKSARRAFQMIHAEHVNGCKQDEGSGQQGDQQQEATGGTLKLDLHMFSGLARTWRRCLLRQSDRYARRGSVVVG